MPDLFIITGSNGAGKSTVGSSFLPERIKNKYEIFDGDKLFMQKRKQIYKIETPSLKEAERRAREWLYEEFENRVANAIKKNDHFVYEGHLPEEGNWVTPKKFKTAGYKINVIFLGLSDTELSELRVLDRAKMGGHNVPPYEIERNFYGNLQQLNIQYPLIDELQVIDTSEKPRVLAIFKNGNVVSALRVGDMPDWFANELSNLYHLVFIKNNKIDFEEDDSL
jgi:predicted ABC-type ATPase